MRSGERGNFLQYVSFAAIIVMMGMLCFSFPSYAREEISSTDTSTDKKDIPVLIVQANDAYKKGLYEDAATLYEKIAATGYMNGHLFYNMGNAYFRQNRIGRAIFLYKKAERILPRDQDLQANLLYAKQQIKDYIETNKHPFFRAAFFWVYVLNMNELVIFFLTLNGFLFILLIMRLFKNTDIIRWSAAFILFLHLVTAGSVFYRYSLEKYGGHGVVLAEQINVRSGIGFDTVTLFNLHEGSEFRIEKDKEDWVRIVLNDGKKGWVKKSFVGVY